jgi:uncharacterized protein (DUF488 family)
MSEQYPTKRKIQLFTIGHSSRTFDDFLSLLREFSISVLVDIRRFPGSRKFPHFNRQSLEATLSAFSETSPLGGPASGIEYLWLEDLGGRRSAKGPASPAARAEAGETSPNGGSGPDIVESQNPGLKSSGFRHYADYMRTEQFHSAVNQLLSVASAKPTAIMCAEKLFWKCHRRLLSDYLVAQGVQIEHIMDSGRVQSHTLTAGAVITPDLNVIYPSAGSTSEDPKLFD